MEVVYIWKLIKISKIPILNYTIYHLFKIMHSIEEEDYILKVKYLIYLRKMYL